MAHQLGRTELEKLAPPERILFWQNRIEFWQKEMVGPPSKMPQERLWFEVQDEKKGLLAQEEAELEAETQKNITLKKVLQFLKIKHALLRSKACELGILDDKLRVI